MFWLAFGTAAAVIGLALMTIGVTRTAPGDDLLASTWFDGGLALLAVGALLLLWSLWLYILHRRGTMKMDPRGLSQRSSREPEQNADAEAVKGYYRERERLFKMWDRERKDKRRKS